MNNPDNVGSPGATVTVERFIAAPPGAVFDAWLDPAMLERWFFGPDCTAATARVDARLGGQYSIVMKGADRDWPHTGEYLELQRPEKLVFSWYSPSTGNERTVVTVILRAEAAGTRLLLTHNRLPPSMAGAFDKGWGELFDHLEKELG